METKKDFLPYVFVGGTRVNFSVEGVTVFLRREDALIKMLSNLSNIARYAGATEQPWTVLMHSLLCANLAREFNEDVSFALFKSVLCHDLAEAFIGDITRPVKSLCSSSLQDFERELEIRINKNFGVKYNASSVDVKCFDDLAAKFEMNFFFGEDAFSTVYKGLDFDFDNVFEYMRKLQSCSKSELIDLFLKSFGKC